MKIQTCAITLTIALCGSAILWNKNTAFSSEPSVQGAAGYVEGEALVLFKEDPTEPNSIEINALSSELLKSEAGTRAIMESRLDALESEISIEPLILFDNGDVQTHSYAEGIPEERLAIGIVRSEKYSTEELVGLLQNDPDVASVQPNYLYDIIEPTLDEEDIVYPNAENMENATRLYGIFNNSSNAGVRADKVWAQGFTGRGVIVADIDTGVDFTHPEFQGKFWQNPGEKNCSDLRDDDNNGFVDDCRGWDFQSNDNNPTPSHPHGTHTSGTVAARKNSDGVVGVAPDAQIMVLKVGSATGIPTSAIVSAMDYAAKNGADIISLSLGGGIQCPTVERAVVQKAINAGVFVVVSSGNAGKNTSTAPANCPGSYGVGATDSKKALASFSSYFENLVDGVAPGVGILSSVPGGGFQSMSGTSMAAPHIAGIAALMRSKNQTLTPQQITDIMCQTAEDLGEAGKDERFGCGFISAEKAVNVVTAGGGTNPSPTPPPPGGVNACHLIKTQADMGGSASFAVPFNPFSPTEMLMTAQCQGTQANVSVGTGTNLSYIYRQGYVFAANQWNPFIYNGATPASSDWFMGRATANLSQVYNPNAPTFFLAYVCLRMNNEWKCGCSDQACAQTKWNIQAFQ